LAALGTDESEDENHHLRAVAGAMALAEGLLDLLKIRKMMAKALG